MKRLTEVATLDAMMNAPDEDWEPTSLQVRNVHGTFRGILTGVYKDGRFDLHDPETDKEYVFHFSDCVVHDLG